MSKSLVIVESPAKAKTINKYLGSGYMVKASMGHVMDLPKKELGVDVEHDFKPTYREIPSKKDVIAELKSAASKPSRSTWPPTRTAKARPSASTCTTCWIQRSASSIACSSTKSPATRCGKPSSIPSEIDAHLVDAQQARRILDRLVGYQVSPLLWDKVRRGISAGRVQTVALRLIVEREREIQAFQKKEYWTITANVEGKKPPAFEARLAKYQGKDLEIPDQATADQITAAIKAANLVVQSVTTKEKRKFPVPPFITSKLQQEAVRKLRFYAKKTMMVAQHLYEGIEIGAMKAPSASSPTCARIPPACRKARSRPARGYIQKTFGNDYLPAEAIHYKSKKGAQDAHEAIRPTDVLRTPDSLRKVLGPDEFKLYKLIWQRFVASQMNPAVFDQTTIDIAAGDYTLRATGSVEKFNGFRAVYEEGKDEKAEMEEDEELKLRLPQVAEGERLKLHKLLPEQHFTEPPPRFNEATLVKTLEEKGIGRPSTYASILSVIQNREYVEKNQGRFYPTELGMLVSDMLVKNFSDIFDVAYTARMEEELDEVEDGKLSWTDALDEFYTKFKKDLRVAEREMVDIKGEGIPTDVKCEKCGKPMVIRLGRNGQFLACTGYPDCDGTSDLPPELAAKYASAAPPAPEVAGQNCEKCGKPMAVKRGRFGYFLACTGYPECRNTKKIVMKEGNGHGRGRPAAGRKVPRLRQPPGDQARPLRAIHRVQQLSHVQIREARNAGNSLPGKRLHGRDRGAPHAQARRFTAAAATPTANSPPGISPSPNPAPIAARRSCWRSSIRRAARPRRHCPNETCKYQRAVVA